MLGVNSLGQVICAVIEGGSDKGATALQEARVMKKLGAEKAINLDGGGSSTFVLYNEKGEMKRKHRNYSVAANL